MPDGFPVHMFSYFRFYRDKGWHPRDVDRLFFDEEYWLPVMQDAHDSAVSQWAEVRMKDTSGPLSY